MSLALARWGLVVVVGPAAGILSFHRSFQENFSMIIMKVEDTYSYIDKYVPVCRSHLTATLPLPTPPKRKNQKSPPSTPSSFDIALVEYGMIPMVPMFPMFPLLAKKCFHV